MRPPPGSADADRRRRRKPSDKNFKEVLGTPHRRSFVSRFLMQANFCTGISRYPCFQGDLALLDVVFSRLQHFVRLTGEDRRILESHARRMERFASHVDLVQEGNEPRYLNMVVEGWACRYRQLEDGRRQILALFVPGDMCDPCVFMLNQMSHALATLTPATIVRISERDVQDVMRDSPNLTKAFWFELLVSAEIQREWTVSLGRRTATERMAHLFCELIVRLRAVGLATANECDLPITQADLGDALGLSSVHVNRTLQEMRAAKLIDLKGRRLVIHDMPALQALALFNPNYLHFDLGP